MSIESTTGTRWFVKISAALSLAFLAAACSTASTRFGPFDSQRTAKVDPGYPRGGPVKPVYTGAITPKSARRSRRNGTPAYDRTVARAPLLARRDRPGNGSITVAYGDTLYSISRTHNVKVLELIAANDLKAPYSLKAGQQLIVPGYASAASRAPMVLKGGRLTGSSNAARGPRLYRVKSGETLYRISLNHGFKTEKVAALNNIPAPYTIKPGQTIKIPGPYRTATAKPVPNAAMRVVPLRGSGSRRKVALKPRPSTGPLPDPGPMSSSKFRWPVKGRIISQFGSKRNGARNDGINLAVPTGTSVKAAENGIVVYAGNELRGYGNLVLIRHARGWVTAYAHNSRLLVVRGKRVRRGEIVAKAGQSGSVTSPQLHFEIRKGAKAVDPVRYLAPTHMANR